MKQQLSKAVSSLFYATFGYDRARLMLNQFKDSEETSSKHYTQDLDDAFKRRMSVISNNIDLEINKTVEERKVKVRKQMKCKCKDQCNGKILSRMNTRAVDFVDELIYLGFDVDIISGLRCLRHNTRVGGAPASKHMLGDALDIKFNKVSYSTVLSMLNKQDGWIKNIPTAYAKMPSGTASAPILHLDFRDGKPMSVTWSYTPRNLA